MNEIVYTRHAETRMRQRGLRERDVPLILKCGTRLDDETWFVRDRDARRAIGDRKREIRTLERLAGWETTPRKCGARPDDGTRFVCGRDARRAIERRKREIQDLERLSGWKMVKRGRCVITAYRSRPADRKKALRRGREGGAKEGSRTPVASRKTCRTPVRVPLPLYPDRARG